jgi:hypothetical protein
VKRIEKTEEMSIKELFVLEMAHDKTIYVGKSAFESSPMLQRRVSLSEPYPASSSV